MNVKGYPARVMAIKVNGTEVTTRQPGPPSSFTYDVEATMDDGMRRFNGIAPSPTSRWPDEVDMWPLAINEPVEMFLIGSKMILKDAEHVPYFRSCNP